jgi:hypothetical protein
VVGKPGSALNLLVARIAAADDTDFAVTTDHLARAANAANGGAYFHLFIGVVVLGLA